MATHLGTYNQAQYAFVNQPGIQPYPIDYSNVTSDYAILADHTYAESPTIVTIHEGLIDRGMTPAQQVLERIYFYPINDSFEHILQYGLITGEEVQEFTIWNAFTSAAKLISNITEIETTGSGHNVPTLPVTLNGMNKKNYNMTVFELGPPIQDSDYIFTVGAEVFLLQVLGERLQELNSIFEPNWKDPVKFSYDFYTVIFRNKVFKEQRRPLYNNVLRAQEASFLVNEADFERAHNILKRAHTDVFFVPIFHELLTPTNPLQGSGFINATEDIEDYYNLMNFTDTLLIKSRIDTTLNEYAEIDSFNIGLNRIILASPIVNNYVLSQTVVIPVFKGRLAGFKPRYHTGKVITFSLQFSEPRRGE